MSTKCRIRSKLWFEVRLIVCCAHEAVNKVVILRTLAAVMHNHMLAMQNNFREQEPPPLVVPCMKYETMDRRMEPQVSHNSIAIVNAAPLPLLATTRLTNARHKPFPNIVGEFENPERCPSSRREGNIPRGFESSTEDHTGSIIQTGKRASSALAGLNRLQRPTITLALTTSSINIFCVCLTKPLMGNRDHKAFQSSKRPEAAKQCNKLGMTSLQ